MWFQDPESTTRREPTLADQRARQHAEREQAKQAELAQQAEYEAAARAQRRRRIMIGGGVIVGVVALVGAWYLFAGPNTVNAQCTAANGADPNTVVADQNCDPGAADGTGPPSLDGPRHRTGPPRYPVEGRVRRRLG